MPRDSRPDATNLVHEPAVSRIFMLDLWATVPYYTAYLSKALQRAGAAVQVGSMTYYLDHTCFTNRGLRPQPGLVDIVGHLRLPRGLRRILKLLEGAMNLLALAVRFVFRPPQVLHIQFLPLLRSRWPLDLWFVRFCAFRGIATVLTVHDLLPHDTGNAHRDLYRDLYRRMDALICHSAHIQHRLETDFGVLAARIAVIPHGPFFFDIPAVDSIVTRAALGIPEGGSFVLWQGIVFPYKGVDLLLTAWQKVEKHLESVYLVVLGTGDEALLAPLQQQAATLGLRRVRFHLRFCSPEELVAAYRAAAAVVYPYRAITTSGALATGLSLGKAVIASRLPVFEELLTDGENALLIDPHDAEELGGTILRLASDPQLRSTLEGAVAAMRFSERSWQGIARDTLRVYQKAERRHQR